MKINNYNTNLNTNSNLSPSSTQVLVLVRFPEPQDELQLLHLVQDNTSWHGRLKMFESIQQHIEFLLLK